MDFTYFKDKRVLITGHTGFKGSWLAVWLNMLGSNVCGYALEPYTKKDNFVVSGIGKKLSNHIGDIRDFDDLNSVFKSFRPEIVFHLAAQPLVRRSYAEPKETFDSNIGGTVNLLECCRLSNSVKIIVIVTSDKCYENYEWPWGYRENDRMGGHDPYSASKACSELICAAYRKSFFNPANFREHGKSLATVRAGNVIGGGDWQEDRLIPDCMRALEVSKPVMLRNPDAVRPWQHVLEPLSGYLLLASRMADDPVRFSVAWNFGPQNNRLITVGELAELIIKKWGQGRIIHEKRDTDLHEAHALCLDITKAKIELNWNPRWDIVKTIDATVEWYKNYQKADMYRFCEMQIEDYLGSEL